MNPSGTASNATWLGLQQISQLASSTIVGVIAARVLPLQEFGRLSFALYILSLATTIMLAGLNSLAVKYVVSARSQGHTMFASLVAIREAMALVAFVVLLGITKSTSDVRTFWTTAIILTAVFARAVDVGDIWFQSTMQVRKAVLPRLAVSVAALGARLIVSLVIPSLMVLVAIQVLEALFSSVLVGTVFVKQAGTNAWGRLRICDMRAMAMQSSTLLVSGILAQIASRADILLLQAQRGAEDVALYSVVCRLGEVAYFMPAAYMNARFPLLLAARANKDLYHRILLRDYARTFWGAVLVAGISIAVGPTVMTVVFGSAFRRAELPFRIYVLALPFAALASVYSKWIITESKLGESVLRHGIGAVVAMAANWILIPSLGILGASIANVLVYVFASYGTSFVGSHRCQTGVLMTRAIVSPWLVFQRMEHANFYHDRSEAVSERSQSVTSPREISQPDHTQDLPWPT